MKISVGTKIKQGPWGGGNLFVINLIKYLEKNNHEVVNNLDHNDIDLILITEPRKTSESSAFTHMDVIDYLNFVNNDAVVVHRINECDERKNTNFINKYMIEANKVADITIFVSSWLKNLYLEQGMEDINKYVVLSGSDPSMFKKINTSKNFDKKLRLVTHHWGANWNKGFEVYKYLDDLLFDDYWKSKIQFTYIGNLPRKFHFNNVTHIQPMYGVQLVDELNKNNCYITGTINEPSGNHHIEASLCGLPVLYINSGGVPEYCNDFGVEFNLKNLKEKLLYLIDNYNALSLKLDNYPHKAEKMSQEYLDIFNFGIKNKDKIIKKRNLVNYKTFSKKLKYYFLNDIY